jgi:hypothetical protein
MIYLRIADSQRLRTTSARERSSARLVLVQIHVVFALLLVVFCNDFSANTADAGFETQSTDNLFEQQVLPARARQSGLDLDFVRVLHVVAL